MKRTKRRFSEASSAVMSRTTAARTTAPKERELECTHQTPIVVAMDVTRSRGDDSKILYDKLPMFFGQLMMQGYVDDPALSFTAIGDATDGDAAPLQVCDFAVGNVLDDWIAKLWLEEGGGGSGQESYELATYFYAEHCTFTGKAEGTKGFFFFTGDEQFYEKVDPGQVESLIGDTIQPISSRVLFRKLQEAFHVFFIYPTKAPELRKADIDAEIQKRLQREGAKSGDIRASLIWHNRNDVDLHCVCPSGEEIFFNNKNSRCGGELDVDMNVRGESTEPVENIYWPEGGAPHGHYRFFVRNFKYHEPEEGRFAFKVELQVNDEVQHFEGRLKGVGSGSDVTVFELDYAGREPDADTQGHPKSREDVYADYSDEKILALWGEVLPPENILVIDDPKAIVDVMLGAVAIVGGAKDLAGYVKDMQRRQQTPERVQGVTKTLAALAEAWKTT